MYYNAHVTFLKNQFKVEGNFIFCSFLLKKSTDKKKAEQTSDSIQAGSRCQEKEGKTTSLRIAIQGLNKTLLLKNKQTKKNTPLLHLSSFVLSSCFFQTMGKISMIDSLSFLSFVLRKTTHHAPLSIPKEPWKQAEVKSLRSSTRHVPCVHTAGRGTFRRRKTAPVEKALLWAYTSRRNSSAKTSNLEGFIRKCCPEWNFPHLMQRS